MRPVALPFAVLGLRPEFAHKGGGEGGYINLTLTVVEDVHSIKNALTSSEFDDSIILWGALDLEETIPFQSSSVLIKELVNESFLNLADMIQREVLVLFCDLQAANRTIKRQRF